MNKLKLGRLIILLGFIFRICETAYFGWNFEAVLQSEKYCDFASIIIVYTGIGIYLSPLINWYSSNFGELKE